MHVLGWDFKQKHTCTYILYGKIDCQPYGGDVALQCGCVVYTALQLCWFYPSSFIVPRP